MGPLDRRRVAAAGHRPRHRDRAARCARAPRGGDPPRHARRPRRRPGPHEPRRLRHARPVLRPGRRRSGLHHRARRRRAHGRQGRVGTTGSRRRPRRDPGRGIGTDRGAGHRIHPRRRLAHRHARPPSPRPARHRGSGRPRRRAGRAERGPHLGAHRPGAARDRSDPAARVRAPAAGVPEHRDRAHVDPHEPRDRGRRVRVRDGRVPARDRHGPARHRAPTVRGRVGAAVLLRAAVRALDGLPAVPARRDPGALRSHRRHQAERSAKASPAPAGRSPTRRS